jgi:murein L,D-transpeptidase YcbB/YkuD
MRFLTCAASAALMIPCAPASAQGPYAMFGAVSDPGVNGFYVSRGSRPLWLANGPNSPAAQELIRVLRRAPLDGYANGPAMASQAEALMARASNGDRDALLDADRLLSTGWVQYVQALERPPSGMTFTDDWARPRPQSPQLVLLKAAAAKSLADYVEATSAVNPVYAGLRDTAWAQTQSTGLPTDPRVLANLDRIRVAPTQSRYIIVDSGSARLFMIDHGQIVDSMKVIVGKPSAQTPMVASTIYYATLNPYWNVPSNLVQSLTAQRVLQQGLGYLKAHGYVVMTSYGDDGVKLDPATVDWKAVASGQSTVAVRQLPGPGNSMGRLKFGFANQWDVYLHDTPEKNLFELAGRSISNGCIRLEDAQRLGRWLLGRDPTPASSEPEQHELLPSPVPIYVTYLTAQADSGQLTFLNDVYGRDEQTSAQLAAIGN